MAQLGVLLNILDPPTCQHLGHLDEPETIPQVHCQIADGKGVLHQRALAVAQLEPQQLQVPQDITLSHKSVMQQLCHRLSTSSQAQAN